MRKEYHSERILPDRDTQEKAVMEKHEKSMKNNNYFKGKYGDKAKQAGYVTNAAMEVMKHGMDIKKGKLPLNFESVEEFEDQVIQFLAFITDKGIPPNLSLFGLWFGVDRQTVYAWMKTDVLISNTVKNVKALIEATDVATADMDVVNSSFAKFKLQAMHNWQEKHQIELVNGGDSTKLDENEATKLLEGLPKVD